MKKSNKNLEKKLDQFIEALDDVHPSTKRLFIRNFFRGIFFGLGTTVGVAIVIGIITYFISQLKTIPFFEALIHETRIEEILPATTNK